MNEQQTTNQNEVLEVPQGPQIASSKKKTKHFSKRLIFFFVLAVGALIAIIGMQSRFTTTGGGAAPLEKNYSPPKQENFAELAAGMRQDRKPVQVVTAPAPEPEKQPQRIVIQDKRAQQPARQPLPRYYSNKGDAQAANTLRTLRLQALTAKPVVEDFAPKGAAPASASASSSAPPMGAPSIDGGLMPDSSILAAFMPQQPAPQDQNGQQGKQDFLRASSGGRAATPQGYSQNIPLPRQFTYELKAGTIIPGLLLTGINSDLPGNVLAQVSENVWDVTGKHVLIPKGTRVIGVYDSQVTYGQQRVLLVWNRLIMPNGTTLNIAGSPGVDQAGYSGLSGKVNEHWGRMFKTALLASVFVAGAEIVYDSDTSTKDDKKTPRDLAAESLAGSILDMSTKIMNKATDIQPTIRIQPGKKMGIFVQEDIAFPFPYF